MSSRRFTSIGLLADVAGLLSQVVAVKHGVGWLRHEHHALPPSEAFEVDPALATLTGAGRDELALLLAVKAVAAHALALVLLDDWLGRRGRRERRF